METEKVLSMSSMIVAGLVALIFALDIGLKLLGRPSIVMDVMFIIGAALVLWQGFVTYREFR